MRLRDLVSSANLGKYCPTVSSYACIIVRAQLVTADFWPRLGRFVKVVDVILKGLFIFMHQLRASLVVADFRTQQVGSQQSEHDSSNQLQAQETMAFKTALSVNGLKGSPIKSPDIDSAKLRWCFKLVFPIAQVVWHTWSILQLSHNFSSES